MANYYRLTSIEDRDVIVRTNHVLDGGKHTEAKYDKALKKWVLSGIMTRYFAPFDENDYYDLFEEITEQEARQAVESQGGTFDERSIKK